nr:hypothetical protein [Halorubrum sp. SD690R]
MIRASAPPFLGAVLLGGDVERVLTQRAVVNDLLVGSKRLRGRRLVEPTEVVLAQRSHREVGTRGVERDLEVDDLVERCLAVERPRVLAGDPHPLVPLGGAPLRLRPQLGDGSVAFEALVEIHLRRVADREVPGVELCRHVHALRAQRVLDPRSGVRVDEVHAPMPGLEPVREERGHGVELGRRRLVKQREVAVEVAVGELGAQVRPRPGRGAGRLACGGHLNSHRKGRMLKKQLTPATDVSPLITAKFRVRRRGGSRSSRTVPPSPASDVHFPVAPVVTGMSATSTPISVAPRPPAVMTP